MRIDLHCHVLPGVDDGASSLDEALEMLDIAELDGTNIVVATPHAQSASRSDIIVATKMLNRFARHEGKRTTVLPGSEVTLASDSHTRYQAGEILGLNETPYVLVELPFEGMWTSEIFLALQRLQLAGAWPILAHAERYETLQRDVDPIFELIAMNVLIQVNARSLDGRSGVQTRRLAEKLARMGAVHIVASDAHDTIHRTPHLSRSLERLTELAGSEHAEWVRTTACAIVHGRQVTLPAPSFERNGSGRSPLTRLKMMRRSR
jgi:protein-tyrosine phosphatase